MLFKTILISLVLMICSIVAAEEQLAPNAPSQPVALTIDISGIHTHLEYQEYIDSIKKFRGVADLIPSMMSKSSVTLKGILISDPVTFISDIQMFAMDRFKLDKKESPTKIEINLKKL